jgi:transposase-like protein
MEQDKIPAVERFKNRYSYAYKVAVVEAIESGKLSQNQASRKYGVHRKTLSGWIKKYSIFEQKLKEMGGKSPQQEIVELRAKLRVAQTENATLRYIAQVVKEEGGDEFLKKYLPESLLQSLREQTKK